MNNLYKRPMFRKGGSAEGGITSGLQRQGYSVGQRVKDTVSEMREVLPARGPKRNFNDFLINFGLDIASRSPQGNIFQTAALSAKDPFKRFQDARSQEELLMEQQKENLEGRRSDMFKTLIEGQSDILAEKTGNTSGVELQKVQVIQDVVPKLYDLRSKVEDGTATDEDKMNIDIYERTLNNLQKKDPITQATLDIFVKSNDGEMLFSKIAKKLFNEDNIAGGDKYGGDKSNDQLRIDALQEMRKVIETTFRAKGGRIGYAQGEMVEEQVTETMDQGPMAQSDNPISYDQLRARLPNEITDDIVELMANSAEALEDFAMISSQQDVDLFNQKYSVNLVLPSEA